MEEHSGFEQSSTSGELSEDLDDLRHLAADFLSENRESIVEEIDREIESTVPGYEKLSPDVIVDTRKSFEDFVKLYTDFFLTDDLPRKRIEALLSEIGRKRARQGFPLSSMITGFDLGETQIWDILCRELLPKGHSARAWIELSGKRDKFVKMARDFLRKSYTKEEKSSVERQLSEFRAISRLGHAIVSSVDLDVVLGQILKVAIDLMQARMGSIMLLDREREYLEPITDVGLSRGWVQRKKIPVNMGLSGVAIRRNEYVLARDDELSGFELPKAAAGRRIRSALSIPIPVDDKPIGVIEIYDTVSKDYTDLDITVLMTFSAQAGVAIKNARLFYEEKKRRKQAGTLTEVAQSISKSRDLEELCETLVEKTASALGVDRCSLFFYDHEANALTFVAGYGRSTLQVWLLNQFHIPMSELGKATAEAISSQKPVAVEELGAESSLESRIFRGPGVHSYLQVPLVVKDELIGLMSVEHTKEEAGFTDDDHALADSLARQAAVAVQNRRLQERLFEQQLAIRNAEINERLYREREKSDAVIKATPDAVFLIDKERNVQLVNPAGEFLTGWSLKEAQGKSCHEVLFGKELEGKCPRTDCPIQKVLTGKRTAYTEDELITRSGRSVPIGGTFAPIFGPGGKVESVAAICRDIRPQKELARYAQMHREMEIASGIQSSLLPREKLEAGGVRIHARLQPARIVGGDWYDYWVYGDKVFMVVGDASGSGIAAALFATMAMSAIRVEAREHESISMILQHANSNLFSSDRSESFVTVFFGVLNLSTMTLSYANAGHEDPLCVGEEGEDLEFLSSGKRSLLGVFSDIHLDVNVRNLRSGERLVLFTDGIIEAKSPKGKFFGLGRLHKFISSHHRLPAEELIDNLVESVTEFSGGETRDDMTVVICDIP